MPLTWTWAHILFQLEKKKCRCDWKKTAFEKLSESNGLMSECRNFIADFFRFLFQFADVILFFFFSRLKLQSRVNARIDYSLHNRFIVLFSIFYRIFLWNFHFYDCIDFQLLFPFIIGYGCSKTAHFNRNGEKFYHLYVAIFEHFKIIKRKKYVSVKRANVSLLVATVLELFCSIKKKNENEKKHEYGLKCWLEFWWANGVNTCCTFCWIFERKQRNEMSFSSSKSSIDMVQLKFNWNRFKYSCIRKKNITSSLP